MLFAVSRDVQQSFIQAVSLEISIEQPATCPTSGAGMVGMPSSVRTRAQKLGPGDAAVHT